MNENITAFFLYFHIEIQTYFIIAGHRLFSSIFIFNFYFYAFTHKLRILIID